MKFKIIFLFTAIFLFVVSIDGFSQASRIVLFEEGTSCFCGPCGTSNPIFDAWLQNNTTNAQAIKYHASLGGDIRCILLILPSVVKG